MQRTFLFCLIVLVLSGCTPLLFESAVVTRFVDPEIPMEQTAKLAAGPEVIITSLDSKHVGSMLRGSPVILLNPGHHTINAYFLDKYCTPRPILFTAKAGHKYMVFWHKTIKESDEPLFGIEYKSSGLIRYLTIEDITNKKVEDETNEDVQKRIWQMEVSLQKKLDEIK